MNLAYKYRIYPNRTQEAQLDYLRFCAWRLYNDSLAARIEHYSQTGQSLHINEIAKYWTRVAKTESGVASLPNDTRARILDWLDNAYMAFFRRITNGDAKKGFPRFQRLRDWKSVPFRGRNRERIKVLDNGKVRLTVPIKSIGTIRMVYHRPVPDNARILWAIVTKERPGHWYVSLQLEFESRPLPSPMFEGTVGIDVGLHYVIATSDDDSISHPRLYIDTLRQQRILHRKLDKQRRANNPNNYNPDGTVKKGRLEWHRSTRMKETERRIAVINAKVKQQREYFWNDITDKLTRNYSYIALEDLSLDFMQQNKRLSKLVHDASIGRFWQLLKFKANERGVHLEWVTPQYTSQTCPVCGCVAPENRRTQAKFICIDCGHKANADVNAARNILKRALEQREFRASNGQMQIWRGLEAL